MFWQVTRQKRSNVADKFIWYTLAGMVLIFVLYPLLCIAAKSVMTDSGFSLEEYRNLFQNNRVLLEHSFFVAVCSAFLSTVLGVLTAVKLSMTDGKKRIFFLAVLMMTMVSPPFIASLMYIQLYGRRGWITYHLLKLSLNPYNQWGIIAMQTLHFTSLNALFTLGILGKVDHSLIYASRDLGAGPEKTLKNVVLPLIRPAVAVCFLLSFVRSLADFSTPIVIGGRYNTLASEIYLQIIGYARLSRAAAMNMLLLIPAVIVLVAYRWLMRYSDEMFSSERVFGENQVMPIRLRGVWRYGVDFPVYLFYIVMGLQYICIFAMGFLKSKKGKYYFSLDHVKRFMDYNFDSLVRSVQYALIVAVAGTLFGMLLAYYMERRKIRCRGFWDFTAMMPYLLPGTCFGIGYILAFNHPPIKLTGTAAIIIISMMFKQLPMVMKTSSAALAQISVKVEEAAKDLGAGKLYVIKDIVLPNLRQAFVTGFVYNFTSAMTTAGAVIFLISARHKLAVYTLFDAINSGEYGVASLISASIIVITLAVSGAVYGLLGRRR